MRVVVFLLVLWPGVGWAGALPCGYEPTERSRAHCLDALTDGLRMRIDAEIGASTVDLMALNARQLRTLERGLKTAQRDWRRQVDRACRDGAGRVAAATCRLRATVERRRKVRAELSEMRERLGMSPLIAIPDEYEVLVPLPDPPAGPDVDPRLPLRIPLSTD